MTITKEQRFKIKYILPSIAIVLTLVVISQFYMTSLKESDLVKITGKVTSIIQDRYHHHKYTDNRITIQLDNSYEPFYFFDDRSNYFPNVLDNIDEGDTVTILHRTKLQSRLGTGSEYKIMKIQKGSKTIYAFDKAKETFSSVGNFTTYAAIGLWLLYFFLRHQIKRQEDKE